MYLQLMLCTLRVYIVTLMTGIVAEIIERIREIGIIQMGVTLGVTQKKKWLEDLQITLQYIEVYCLYACILLVVHQREAVFAVTYQLMLQMKMQHFVQSLVSLAVHVANPTIDHACHLRHTLILPTVRAEPNMPA